MTDLTQAILDPTKTVGEAATLAELPGTEGDLTTTLGSLLNTVGATVATPITPIGTIPSAGCAAVVGAWEVRVPARRGADPPVERDPTLVETGKALYLGRIARSKLGLENIVVATAPAPLTASPTGASAVASRKVKMNQILSQLDETEVDVVTAAEQVRMLARYETLYGKGQRPQPNQEPSIEQLSGLKALVDGGQCPYADFAIFQPYAARIMKRIKFSGLVITKSGALSQAEIYGPPDLDSWRSSYDVWANAMIMLDIMDLGPLQTYKARIENLHSRYGESNVWSLLYQADTRARLEHMPRSKIQLYRHRKEATDAGGTTPYDDARPWNYTLQVVAADDKYWSHEFVEPADFNQGNCSNTVQGSWCGADSSLAHQCSRCLGTHPLTKCHHQEQPAVGGVKRGAGKGKGKSKRGKGRKGQNPY